MGQCIYGTMKTTWSQIAYIWEYENSVELNSVMLNSSPLESVEICDKPQKK